jgi:hypothetical protein
MKEHFKVNHRLTWVFRVCKALGIDDPVHWMNTVSPAVVDQWIAFELSERDKGEPTSSGMSPEDALVALKGFGAA